MNEEFLVNFTPQETRVALMLQGAVQDLAGHGIAPMNEYTVASSLPAGRLKVIAASRGFGIHESIYLITRKRRWPNPIADRLVKNFRALFTAKSGRVSPLL